MFETKQVHVKWPRSDVTTWTPYHQNGQVYEVYSTGFSNMLELYRESARVHANEEFLVDDLGRRMTFAQVMNAAEVLSESLRNQQFSGLKHGDRVGVCGRNSIEWIVSFFAASYAGMIVIPMNSWWTTKELEYAIKHVDCKAIFIDNERIERMKSISSDLIENMKIIGMEANPPKYSFVSKYENWMDFGKKVEKKSPLLNPLPDERAAIMFTSGTTNFPKGVVLTHRGMCHTTNTYHKFSQLALEQQQGQVKDKKKAILLSVPLFHATGLYAIFFASLLIGRKIVILRKWNAEKALELIEKERVTQFTGVPTMVLEMLSSPDLKKRDISSLKHVGSGGAAPPAGVAKQIKEKLNALPGQGYGLTEVNAVATSIGAADYEQRPTSCGKPVPGLQIQIWSEDKDHVQVPIGQDGRIVMRGPTIMLEYWNDYEATNKAITHDGWFKCGDYGHLDEEGFLFISGRSQDLIIRGGENISARTVEEAIFELFDSIQECAVFAVPHATLGEEVGCAIFMKPNEKPPTLDEIREKLSTKIAQYMIPTGLTVFSKKLPRGATGKTVKKDIKQMLLNGKLENWNVHQKAKI